MTLAQRIYAEKRGSIVPLLVALAANLGIYAVAVYPLAIKVRAADERASTAQAMLRSAERNFATAQATRTGKDRADEELRKFYGEVLPVDLAGARRITYLRLAQLAQRANLRYERRSASPEHERDSRLNKLRMTMVLAGEYRDIRQFIYALETAPEFIVIEDVAVTQGAERGAPLVLTLEVSTYYWTGGDGA